MSKKNGGPAFPFVPEAPCNIATGMTLRDYFAAKMMAAIYGRVTGGGFDCVAQRAYEMADAMLRAREST